MSITDKLIKVAADLFDKGELELAHILDDAIDDQVMIEAETFIVEAKKGKGKSKSAKCSKYKSPEGHFKGKAGTGERFKNCVKYQVCMGKSRDAGTRICAAIKKRKYGGLDNDPIVVLRAVELREVVAQDEYIGKRPGAYGEPKGPKGDKRSRELRYPSREEQEKAVKEYAREMPGKQTEEEVEDILKVKKEYQAEVVSELLKIANELTKGGHFEEAKTILSFIK